MKYKYNLQPILNEDALSYYLLGVFITDGCVVEKPTSKYVSLYSKDKEWIESIKNIFCLDVPLKFYNGAWYFILHSTKLANWLISNNCTPNKSLTVKFPNVPSKFLSDFIRGCLDGDGTLGIYKCKNKQYFVSNIVSASQDFANSMSKILKENDCSNSLLCESKNRINPLYKVNFSGKNAYLFLKWIYYKNNLFTLKRKEIIASSIILRYENKYGTNITNTFNVLENENNPNAKLQKLEVESILFMWFNKSANYLSKKDFYIKEIKTKFMRCTCENFYSIINGRSWKSLHKKYNLKITRGSATTRRSSTKSTSARRT